MINYTVGNILKSDSEALVNTVNTKGVMGKGIALAFKKAFPLNFKLYKSACDAGTIDTGKLLITETGQTHPKFIINFPTKKHWSQPSKYDYIEDGMKDLIEIIQEYDIKSISIPPLGSGNGRLEWEKVKNIILRHTSEISDRVELTIYEPGYQDQTIPAKKDVNLTDARTLFIYLLWHYQILGYQINLLVAQKIAYFLQKYGEKLNLDFVKGYYGPYSNRLNHLLKHINNCYIYFDESKNTPATKITIDKPKFKFVEEYYQNKISKAQKERTEKVLELIEGFESSYGLELLATIDFIKASTEKKNFDDIYAEIGNWTRRKKEIMKPHHIKVALKRLDDMGL